MNKRRMSQRCKDIWSVALGTISFGFIISSFIVPQEGPAGLILCLIGSIFCIVGIKIGTGKWLWQQL
jgi:hypothetical protein